MAVPVSAAATVTPASGGGAISADDAGGAWTTLGSIVITEGAAGDISADDFVLTIPAGFEFDTTSVPDVAVTGTTPQLAANSPAAITATTITVTVTAASTTETDNALTIGGVTPIKVRPTAGTPLASGEIHMTSGTINGVDGTTNFGTLTEVHGVATQFVIINPADGTVDAAITVTVQLQDQYGNIVTTGVDKDKNVTLNADGSATGAGLVNIGNGVGTKDISDQVAETVNLSLTDSQGTGFTCTSTQNVIFAHGVATQFVIINPADGTVDAAITVTVQLQDQYGNIVTTGVDKDKNVTLNADGSATGAGLVNIGNGVGTKDISDQVAETVNLSLTDSQGTGLDVSSTQDVIFAIGAIDHYSVSAITSPRTVGVAFNVTIQAQNQYNNNITTGGDATETVNITFGKADAGATPTSTTTASGTATVSMTMTVAQTGQSITFTGATSGKAGTSNSFNVTPPGDLGGWVAPTPTPTIETTLFGITVSFSISDTGEILETVTGTSADGNLTITIPTGTIALDKDGNPLSTLTSDVDVSPPPPPSYIIGLAYDFGPDGATFDPAITLTWSYDPDALPESVVEEDLVIAYYDEDACEWVDLPSTVDLVTHTITASVSHFTTFAVIAHAAPTAFSASNLSIQPPEVHPKEAVTIRLSVANTGDTEGSYAVVLKINGVKEAEKSVTVAAGASEEVTFTIVEKEAGSYKVEVNGLVGEFTVEAPAPGASPPPAPAPPAESPINWAMLWCIVGGVVVVGLIIFFLVRRRAY